MNVAYKSVLYTRGPRSIAVETSRFTTSATTSSSKVSLSIVLSHANGLCKEIWRPFLGHLVASLTSTLQFDVIHTAAWDAFMAGDSAALNPHLLVDAKTHRPLELLDWSQHAEDLVFISQWARNELKRDIADVANPHKHIVLGIGHSLGGFATLRAEELAPGCFDGIVVLEPIIFPPGSPKTTSMREGEFKFNTATTRSINVYDSMIL